MVELNLYSNLRKPKPPMIGRRQKIVLRNRRENMLLTGNRREKLVLVALARDQLPTQAEIVLRLH